MGAERFAVVAKGRTVSEAFAKAKEQAYYEYGHRGYTGSVAEKGSYRVLPLHPNRAAGTKERAHGLALTYLEQGDQLPDDQRLAPDAITNKWGPAGAIFIGLESNELDENSQEVWLFFGYASS